MPSGYIAFLGIALGCFYCYMPIDSYRVAKARQLGQAEPGGIGRSKNARPIGRICPDSIGRAFPSFEFRVAGRPTGSRKRGPSA